MIEVEKLTIRYGPVTAVDGLTFTARPGHVTGFPGPNGAGGAVPIGVIAPLADIGPSCPTGSGLAGFFAAGGHAGSRFSARQRQQHNSAPMRHADDDHAGHPMPQPAR
jgi:ABC-2 type transport system ATP-binding protein